MAFRLCWLLLAIFVASCSGGSDSDESAGTFGTTVINPDPSTPVQPGSAIFTYGGDDSVNPFAVSEIPSSKAQTISLKGATIPFTATAGHLIASSDAAIFYTAYTRNWDYEPDPAMSLNTDRWLTSISDMTLSMTLNQNLKVLVQHGYYDLNTPFHQSELDIAAVTLSAKIPVKLYEGGHGVSPYDTGSYDQVMQDLGAFYDQLQPKLAAANTAVAERARP